MNEKNNSSNEDNRNDIKVILENFSTFLFKSHYLEKYLFNKNQIELLNNPVKNDFTKIFEFNNKITVADVSQKYTYLLKNLNSIFNKDSTMPTITFDLIYSQYNEYSKTNLSFSNFLNILIMLDYILNNFNEIINIDEIKCLLNEKISIIQIGSTKSTSNEKDEITKKLSELYDNINNNPTFLGNKIYSNLIILIFIISMNGIFITDSGITNKSKLMKKFSVYNKTFISNIHVSLILFIQMILFINLYTLNISRRGSSLHSKKNNVNFLNNNEFFSLRVGSSDHSENAKKGNNINKTQMVSDHISKSTFEKEMMEDDEIIINIYLFEDEIVNFKKISNSLKIVMFQNYLKFFSLYYMAKNQIKLNMNLYIESIIELDKYYKLKNNNSKFEFGDDKNELIQNLNLDNIELITKENIDHIFFGFNISEFVLKLVGFNNEKQIKKIIDNFFDLIIKSNSFYIQEPNFISLNEDISSISMNHLLLEYKILCYFLDFYNKTKKLKKSITIKMNMYKLIINYEKKTTQIFFDFSAIKEKFLFQYLKTSKNLLHLEMQYENIIDYVNNLKMFDITIRILQTQFHSHQVNFFFTLIIKKVVDYINLMKYNKIIIYDTKFNTFNPNLQVYIKDETIKRNILEEQIKQMIQYQTFDKKFLVLNSYLDELIDNWDLIVISDRKNEFTVLRTFDDNKLFFYLSKDLNKNYVPNPIQNNIGISITETNIENNNKNNEDYYEYINVIMYFKNDEKIFANGINFIDSLIDNKNSILEYKTTLICDRFFLESDFIMEPSLKKIVKIFYNVIDDMFLIAKNIINENEEQDDNEFFNYDVYIADNYIAVSNYHPYDISKDKNYGIIISEFLSVLSSCVELILYLLKNKDIYIQQFLYLIRTIKEDYYMFEYKNSNMFIKKVKEFDSLISLNLKNCFPLFSFISKKIRTKYVVSNDNFYDVFLRYFLNLNRVVDSNEKLNEIFLQKVHKNIFYECYDTFILIAFTYQAFNFFTNFFISNDYLSITKGEKFDKCYIIPCESFSKKNYLELLKYAEKGNLITKNNFIFNHNINSGFIFKNPKYFTFGFKKAEFLFNAEAEFKKQKFPETKEKMRIIFQKLKIKVKKKENIKILMKKIKNFAFDGNNIEIYLSNRKEFGNIIEDYLKEKLKINTQKVETRVYQLTENAKNTIVNTNTSNKKDCNVF